MITGLELFPPLYQSPAFCQLCIDDWFINWGIKHLRACCCMEMVYGRVERCSLTWDGVTEAQGHPKVFHSSYTTAISQRDLIFKKKQSSYTFPSYRGVAGRAAASWGPVDIRVEFHMLSSFLCGFPPGPPVSSHFPKHKVASRLM